MSSNWYQTGTSLTVAGTIQMNNNWAALLTLCLLNPQYCFSFYCCTKNILWNFSILIVLCIYCRCQPELVVVTMFCHMTFPNCGDHLFHPSWAYSLLLVKVTQQLTLTTITLNETVKPYFPL